MIFRYSLVVRLHGINGISPGCGGLSLSVATLVAASKLPGWHLDVAKRGEIPPAVCRNQWKTPSKPIFERHGAVSAKALAQRWLLMARLTLGTFGLPDDLVEPSDI